VGKVQDAGDELFHLFKGIVPLPNDVRGRKTVRQSDAQISASLNRFYAEAKVQRVKHGLGIFSRARVLRHLQNQLISAGYEPDLVSRVILSLVLSAFTGREK
jgi:hypothetical protein